jgi:aminoglycoside phosphotransferase family enzyme/predicted kinase
MPEPFGFGRDRNRTDNKDVDAQDRVFAYLADPRTHGGFEVKRIDTHASTVFLAGNRAYKVKRSMRFPYLDYSTPEKRKAACLQELTVNRRFSPELYLRVAEIRDFNGRLSLEGAGTPIEWAVVMKRFDESLTLDRLAECGSITNDLADELGRMVARMHAEAPVIRGEMWQDSLSTVIEENETDLKTHPDLFDAGKVRILTLQSKEKLKSNEALISARAAAGFVREGHGDLHLRNIALIDGNPTPFDAIEFDPLLASGDIFYELSFLLMDLWERNARDPANIVLNRYLIETNREEHLSGLALLPLFLSMRSAIRAKICATELARSARANENLAKGATRYFNFAVEFLRPDAPRLVVVGGLSGSGKSALARLLASHLSPAPGAVILRSDIERKRLFHASETEPLPSQAYRPDVSGKVYERLFQKTESALQAKHSVILDATFLHEAARDAALKLSKRCSVPLAGLYLDADLNVRLERIAKRKRDASDADAKVAMQQRSPSNLGAGWTRIDANADLNTTVQRALKAIGVTDRQ